MREPIPLKRQFSATFIVFGFFVVALHIILLYAVLSHFWYAGSEIDSVGKEFRENVDENVVARRAKIKELVRSGTFETSNIASIFDRKLGWTVYERSRPRFPVPSTLPPTTTTITTSTTTTTTTTMAPTTTTEFMLPLTQDDSSSTDDPEYLSDLQWTSIELSTSTEAAIDVFDDTTSVTTTVPTTKSTLTTTTLAQVEKNPIEFVPHKHVEDRPKQIHITQNLLRQLQPPVNKHRNQNYDHYGVVEKPNTTLVTALMDIGREHWHSYRRPMAKYHDYMAHVLMLKVPLVAFVDNHSAEFVAETRKAAGLAHITKIYEINLEALPLYRHMDVFRAIIYNELHGGGWQSDWDESMRTHPEAKSAEYDLVVNSKPYFVHNVSTDNPFNTHFFAWIDAGYGQAKPEYFPKNYEWKPFFPAGRVSLAKVTPYFDDIKRYTLKELYRKDRAVISGGFFGGDRAAIAELYSKYNGKMLDLLFRYRVVDDDQTTFVLVINEYPSLFNVLHADWFDAFKLFRRRRRRHHRHHRHHTVLQ